MIRVLAVAALSLLAAGCGSDPAVQTRTPPGDIEATYAVHGDRLYLHCTGRGSPVVVLEAGLGGDHRGWDAVQPELARTTRVCSYDHAGLAFSDAAPKRATSATMPRAADHRQGGGYPARACARVRAIKNT